MSGNGVEGLAAAAVRENGREALKIAEPIQASDTSNLEKYGNKVLQPNIEVEGTSSEQSVKADVFPSTSTGGHTKSKESAQVEELEMLSEHEEDNSSRSSQGSNFSVVEVKVSNMIQFNSPSFLAGDGEKNINVLVLGNNLPLNLFEAVKRNVEPGINFNLIYLQSLVPSKDLHMPTQFAVDENCIHYVVYVTPCTNPAGLVQAAKEFSYIDGLFVARKRFTVLITRKNAVYEECQIRLDQLKAFAITMNKPCINVYIDDPEAMQKSSKILYNHIKRLVCNPLM